MVRELLYESNICTLVIDGEEYRAMSHMPSEMCDSAWQQGLILDDYDYLIVCDPSADSPGFMLDGCCDNTVYEFLWDGKTYQVGLAYHA